MRENEIDMERESETQGLRENEIDMERKSETQG